MSKVGEVCKWDSDCKNDACGRVGRPGADGKFRYECCESGETHMHSFSDYCVQAVGARCEYDGQCPGSALDAKCEDFKCRGGTMPDGAPNCTLDADCVNLKCGRVTKAHDRKFYEEYMCCPGDMQRTLLGQDYCVMDPGTKCTNDVQCTSGKCSTDYHEFTCSDV